MSKSAFVLATSVAMVLSAFGAEQVPEKVFEFQVGQPADHDSLNQLGERLRVVVETNAATLKRSEDEADPVVFVLRIYKDDSVDGFYGIVQSTLEEDLAEHDTAGFTTFVIRQSSPFYLMAARALEELSRPDGEKEVLPRLVRFATTFAVPVKTKTAAR